MEQWNLTFTSKAHIKQALKHPQHGQTLKSSLMKQARPSFKKASLQERELRSSAGMSMKTVSFSISNQTGICARMMHSSVFENLLQEFLVRNTGSVSGMLKSRIFLFRFPL